MRVDFPTEGNPMKPTLATPVRATSNPAITCQTPLLQHNLKHLQPPPPPLDVGVRSSRFSFASLAFSWPWCVSHVNGYAENRSTKMERGCLDSNQPPISMPTDTRDIPYSFEFWPSGKHLVNILCFASTCDCSATAWNAMGP